MIGKEGTMGNLKRIVIIDDEKDLCLMVKANLEDSGEFEVLIQPQATEAENFIH